MAQILLADANPTNRRIVELSFADEGVDVVSFADGKQAAEYLRENEVEVVLADVSMPGLDGYQLCLEAKRSPGGESVPVVLLSGRFQQFDAQRAEEVGYHCQVSKPVEPANLVELVQGLLRDERPGPGRGARPGGSGSPAVTVHPQESAMLFEIPVEPERQKAVFSLKPYQCKPSAGRLRREVPSRESAAEPQPREPQAQPVPEHPETGESREAPRAQPPEAGAREKPTEGDVERVVSKLADQLPDIVRTILQEEKSRE